MTAKIIDGKAIAAELRAKVAQDVHRLTTDHGLVPGLAVVLVGDNPASLSYVRSKAGQVVEAGMRAFDPRLPETTSEAELLALIARLNADPAVHGILVQLPLPPHIDAQTIITAIDPAKDVDGLHPSNAGRLANCLPALVPCTPLGCIILAKTVVPSLSGLEAVVVGRSKLVGKPLVQLLLAENATVTIAHSKTRDLAACPRCAGVPTCCSPPPGAPRWCAATGSSVGPPSSMSASTALPRPTAKTVSSATLSSPKRAKSPARFPRCRAASAR